MKNKFDPELEHLSSKDFENVYEPNTDTFAFVDALEKDLESILSIKPTFCLEIG
jgi:release factor glutamine methyltransferase